VSETFEELRPKAIAIAYMPLPDIGALLKS
jgi:hypothetical protein